MIEDEITFRVLAEFHFTPTAEQRDAVSVFASFITDRDPHSVMVLRVPPVR